MPLDPNIALNANAPQPTNPLQTALQVAQYRTANAQGQALQQGIAANQATSAAYQQATDPTTGQVDNNKLMALISQDPRAAYNMSQIAQGINTQKQQQQTLSAGQLELAKNQNSFLNQKLGSIDPSDPNFQAHVMQTATEFVHNYQGDPQKVMGQLSDMPPIGSTPQQNSMWLQRHLSAIGSVGEQLKALQPSFNTINSGPATIAVNQNPMALGGVGSVGYTVQNGLSPSDATSQVPIIQPNGAPGTISKAQAAIQQGQGNLVGSAPGAGAGTQPSPIGDGRYPSAGGAAPQSAPAAPGGVLQTGLAPGVAQAADVAGTASGNQMVSDQQANAGSGQRVYQLQAALKGLQGAGSTGPGTAEVNNAKSFLLAQSPDWMKSHLPGIDPNQIASYDEANKYLTQYASAKASSLGSGTDSKLATTLSGNASTHISGLAAQDVVKANIGLERMGQAQQDAFSQSGLPAAQYSQWASKFGSTLDPRVFIADQMEPAKVKTMYDKMQPKEQAQFRTQYNWAVQKGYLNGPQ